MSKLSDQELLEIIQTQSSEPATPLASNNLPLFINTFGLEVGDLAIPVKLVYRLYKAWSKEKISEPRFYEEMTLLMPAQTDLNGAVCYLLNKSTLKITENIYNLVKDRKIKQENTIYYKKHFESFMKSCNIVKGSDWIPVSELRTVYLAWIKTKYKKNILSFKNFEGFCKLYMDIKGNPMEIAVNKKDINAPKKESGQEKAAAQTESKEK